VSPTVTVAGLAWRLAAWDTPFWVHPNRAAGRFNPPATGPVQYWSLHPLTPWAELLRGQGVTQRERLRDVRSRLWVARVRVEAMELDFAAAPELGLEPADLVADDRSACQRLGERCLAGDGPAALVVPSAALPGTRNLVIFGPRVASPFAADPVDPDLDVPTTVAAEDARPVDGLLDLVRFRGVPHAELEAWTAGRPFRLEEPPLPLPR